MATSSTTAVFNAFLVIIFFELWNFYGRDVTKNINLQNFGLFFEKKIMNRRFLQKATQKLLWKLCFLNQISK
jgi:hypothetical protein